MTTAILLLTPVLLILVCVSIRRFLDWREQRKRDAIIKELMKRARRLYIAETLIDSADEHFKLDPVRDRLKCHELHKQWETLRHRCEHRDSRGQTFINAATGQCAACLNNTKNEGF